MLSAQAISWFDKLHIHVVYGTQAYSNNNICCLGVQIDCATQPCHYGLSNSDSWAVICTGWVQQ